MFIFKNKIKLISKNKIMEIKKEENGDIMQFIKEKKMENKESNNNILNNELLSEVNEEKIKNLKIQYNMFRIFLYKKLRKKEYKTVLNQIEGNYQIYQILEESEELLFLKIEILIKIIKHKIQKYDYIYNDEIIDYHKDSKIKLFSSTKYSSKILKKIFQRKNICKNKLNHLKLNTMNIILNIEKYYIAIYKELNKLIEKIPNIYQNCQIIYIEKIIQLYLKLFLVKANHHEKNDQLLYSIYYLSLGKKLILKFNDYIRDIKTFGLIEKIYLYLAKLLFINQDFYNVQKYCINIITYSFKELVFRFGDKIDINSSEFKNNEKNNFFYLCNAILYICFCKEEIGEINIAYKLYNYVNYIYKNFLNDINFKKFISKLYIRGNQYNNIFKEFFQFQNIIKAKNLINKKIDLNHKISYYSNTYYHNQTFEKKDLLKKIPSMKNNNLALSENSVKFEPENMQLIKTKESFTYKSYNNLPIMNKKKVTENENINNQKTINYFQISNSSFNLNDYSINKKINSSSIININNHKILSDKITRNFKENISMVIKGDNERKDNNNNNKHNSDIMINNNSLIDTSNSNQILLKSVKKINSCSDINSNDDTLHLSYSYNLKEKKYYFFPHQLNNSLVKNFFSEKKRKIQNLNRLEVKKRNFNFVNYSSFKKINKYLKKDYFVKFQNQKKKELNKINFESIKTLYISSPPITKLKNNIFSAQSNDKIPFINILNLNKNKKNENKKIIFSKLNLMKPLIKNLSNDKNQINNDSKIIKIKKRFNSK